mmetsp:Transcript_15674/g.39849  ORF Transcript_15674/g.39849 Transcript_15674/m.39849 type:complete len:267 (-) Transcript_15674:7-807(-)
MQPHKSHQKGLVATVDERTEHIGNPEQHDQTCCSPQMRPPQVLAVAREHHCDECHRPNQAEQHGIQDGDGDEVILSVCWPQSDAPPDEMCDLPEEQCVLEQCAQVLPRAVIPDDARAEARVFQRPRAHYHDRGQKHPQAPSDNEHGVDQVVPQPHEMLHHTNASRLYEPNCEAQERRWHEQENHNARRCPHPNALRLPRQRYEPIWKEPGPSLQPLHHGQEEDKPRVAVDPPCRVEEDQITALVDLVLADKLANQHDDVEQHQHQE